LNFLILKASERFFWRVRRKRRRGQIRSDPPANRAYDSGFPGRPAAPAAHSPRAIVLLGVFPHSGGSTSAIAPIKSVRYGRDTPRLMTQRARACDAFAQGFAGLKTAISADIFCSRSFDKKTAAPPHGSARNRVPLFMSKEIIDSHLLKVLHTLLCESSVSDRAIFFEHLKVEHIDAPRGG
jgi:hypothetical protein